jgi:ribonuclease VapC
MVIDSSAIIAILSDESDAAIIAQAIQSDPIRLMSGASLLETAIVIESRYGLLGAEKLDQLVKVGGFQIEPVTVELIELARSAYRLFGKGRHRAALNFGDRFLYALAKFTNEPLLFKGNNFSQTDLQSVLNL